MLINFDEEKFMNAIVKDLMTVEDIYIDDIYEAILEDLDEWFANYGLTTDLLDGIVEKIEEKNVKVIK